MSRFRSVSISAFADSSSATIFQQNIFSKRYRKVSNSDMVFFICAPNKACMNESGTKTWLNKGYLKKRLDAFLRTFSYFLWDLFVVHNSDGTTWQVKSIRPFVFLSFQGI